MKSIKILILVFSTFLLGACASTNIYIPTSQDMEKADFGTFPENYQELVKNYMERRLKDPESVRYRFQDKPIKWYEISDTLATTVFNYQLVVFINAKNSYGGYTGENEYRFSLKNGVITNCVNVTAARNGSISNNWQC